LQGQLAFERAQGLEVALLCSPGEHADRLATNEGVEHLPVPMPRKLSPIRDAIALLRICAALARVRPDIVNAGTPKAGFLTILAAWICRVPHRIYTLRGLYLETSSGIPRMLLHSIERLTCRLAETVICVSPSLRSRALEIGVVDARKAVVLGAGSSNGVDVARFTGTDAARAGGRELRASLGIPPDAVLVGFVGRVAEDKGLLELADGWGRVSRQCPTAHLLIVGPAEIDTASVGVWKALASDAHVHVAGEVGRIEAYYAAMDLVVLPTYREGLPNVLLEAAAMELPVVATRVTGCVDAVQDGVTGTLVTARDAAALAAAILAYARDPALRATHGRAARAMVERLFPRERVWLALHEQYLKLLHDKRPRPPAGEHRRTAKGLFPGDRRSPHAPERPVA
jgi:glycosyltransferase involved in cell wall biosynthesis